MSIQVRALCNRSGRRVKKNMLGDKFSSKDPHIIKKYANRRLYDTYKSAYITLDDLKQYVLDFVPFSVIDAKSKEDVTKSCLIQIIFEMEGTSEALFTREILEHFVRFYGHPLQIMLREYLEKSFSFFAVR